MSKNRIINFFTTKSRLDGIERVPNRSHDPTLIHRLSFKHYENSSDVEKFSRAISTVPTNVAFFLDTNMWDAKLDSQLWPVLLDRGGALYVAPSVTIELEEWAKRNRHLLCSVAYLERRNPLILLGLPTDEVDLSAYVYYTSLLHERRSAITHFTGRFSAIYGRTPTDDEVVEGVQRLYGQRGLALVHKHGRRVRTDPWATDESVVYSAAAHSLRTGEPTVILSQDQDVLEQFYKLWWFLDTHYRAKLMADEFVLNPSAYERSPMPDTAVTRNFFEADDGFLLNRGNRRMREVLPLNRIPVTPECWLIGKSLVRMSFGAEREMSRLLDVKGETGGLVSADLGGRNLHAYLGGALLDRVDPNIVQNCIAVVRDNAIDVWDGRARLAHLDITYSLFSNERFTRLEDES
jgi:hypothetical protein